MRTYVYIDGFNFYYGCLKGSRYKWLNVDRFCQLMLPQNQILKIKYFTARVNARPRDPDQPVRQQTFLRALATLPNVEIVFGHFLSNECMMLKAGCLPGKPQYVRVVKTEEKGSDVNIAAHLINDGYKGLYDVAVLVTNDSDLLEPVRIVRQELKLKVGILNPHKHPSRVLVQQATFIKQIRHGVLATSQFPTTLSDTTGVFSRPRSW